MDRVLLMLLSLLAVGAGVWFIMQTKALPERFVINRPTPDMESDALPTKRVDSAIKKAGMVEQWITTKLEGKALPLNTSITLVEKNGKVIDMTKPGEESPRPPFTNEWLLKYSLDYRRDDLAQLDEDNDGFNNAEEFEGRTDPTDKKSHPPLTNKLFLAARVPHPYRIVLSGSGQPVQVRRLEPAPPRGTFLELNPADPNSFVFPQDDKRFRAVKFEKKVLPPDKPGGIDKDVSELTVEDRVWKETFVMIFKQEVNREDADAIFEYRRMGRQQVNAKWRGTFTLPDDTTTYYVKSLEPQRAVIAPAGPDGQPNGADIVINFATAK